MSRYLIGGFLLLYGVTALLTTTIPPWVTGVVALAAGAACVIDAIKQSK